MIYVYYTDDSESTHDTLLEAQQDIQETILGCNFAVGVDQVCDDKGNNYGCNWSVSLEQL